MARPDDLVGYTYRANNYCELCILIQVTGNIFPVPHAKTASVIFHLPVKSLHNSEAERALNALAALCDIDRECEETFDTGDFPKVIHRDQAREGQDQDDASTCGRCGTNLATVPAIPWREAANDASVSHETEAR